jgi:hypothetical protein
MIFDGRIYLAAKCELSRHQSKPTHPPVLQPQDDLKSFYFRQSINLLQGVVQVAMSEALKFS